MDALVDTGASIASMSGSVLRELGVEAGRQSEVPVCPGRGTDHADRIHMAEIRR